MRYLTAFVIALLIACTVMQCGGPRTTATRIKTARTRRLDEIDGI